MTERDQFITGLRELAFFFEMNPNCPVPWPITMFKWITADEVKPIARSLRTFKKNYDGNDFEMRKTFGNLGMVYYTNRENVCKKVVVGMKEIPEMIIAAKPEQIVPASEEQIIPAHTEDITEWVCADAVLMEETAAEAEMES